MPTPAQATVEQSTWASAANGGPGRSTDVHVRSVSASTATASGKPGPIAPNAWHEAADAQDPTIPEMRLDDSPGVPCRLHVPDDSDSTTGPFPHAVQVSDVVMHETEVSTAADGSEVSAVHFFPASCSAKPASAPPLSPTATQTRVAEHETEASDESGRAEARVPVQTPCTSTSINASSRSLAPTATQSAVEVHEIEARESLVTPEGSGSAPAVHAPPDRLVTNA